MRKLAGTLLIAAALAVPAYAGTPMLTAAGVTSATHSTCPTTGQTAGCSGGWFSVRGAAAVAVTIESATTSSATVKLKWRAFSGADVKTLKTVSNPAAGDVHWICDPVGEYYLDVTVYASGTITGAIDATTHTGARLW